MTISGTRVLVVGASGNIGTKVVRELIARGAAHVRATYRAGTKPEIVATLRETGAELVTADLDNAASLAAACAGVSVVVSTVQGLRDTIVDGQARLLRAAEAAGVARMIPSDYSLDFFKTPVGSNRNLDLRREFNALLDASRVRGTSVLCGAFMDLIGAGRIGPDPKTGVYKVWGDPDQPYDFTHTDDVAAYIAAVALDNDAPRFVRIAGDTKSPTQIAAIVRELRGTPVTIERAGSVEALGGIIEGMRRQAPATDELFPVWQQMQYGRDMASGLGRLDPLDNARYPSIHPRSIRDLLHRVPAI